jgi:hypothetical protein
MLSRYSCLQCTFFFYSKCFHFFSVWIVRCIKFQVFFVSQICLYYLVSITLKILCIVNNVSHVRLVFFRWQLYCFKIIKKWVQSKSNSFARNHDNFFLFSGRKIACIYDYNIHIFEWKPSFKFIISQWVLKIVCTARFKKPLRIDRPIKCVGMLRERGN